MKKIIAFLMVIVLLSCNNSATVTPPSDADQTKNNDTMALPKDSGTLQKIDSVSK